MSDSDKQYIQQPKSVALAHNRIKHFLHRTAVTTSTTLNKMLAGHKIFFKLDALQKTGAFKVRGIFNHLLELQEQGKLPEKVVAYSTGNHGIGLAYAAGCLGIKARIYLPSNTSRVKRQAAEHYGAEVIYTETRQQAEDLSKNDVTNGFYFLHPSDSDSTMAGAGTACFEALQDIDQPIDAIFAAIGGGGLISGTYLAKELLAPRAQLFGVEPAIANDAYQSRQQGHIVGFTDSPQTIADGLRTLKVSPRAYAHIKQLDDIFLVDEEKISYWTAWLLHLLKIACEPSCAMNMDAVIRWLSTQQSPKNVLVIISGGNIDPLIYREIWQEDHLLVAPEVTY